MRRVKSNGLRLSSCWNETNAQQYYSSNPIPLLSKKRDELSQMVWIRDHVVTTPNRRTKNSTIIILFYFRWTCSLCSHQSATGKTIHLLSKNVFWKGKKTYSKLFLLPVTGLTQLPMSTKMTVTNGFLSHLITPVLSSRHVGGQDSSPIVGVSDSWLWIALEIPCGLTY